MLPRCPQRWRLLVAGSIFSATLMVVSVAWGQTLTTLFSFDGTHGSQPSNDLTLSGSTLYGMTYQGGANGCGTVFSIPVAGGTPTTLVSFDPTAASPANPVGGLTLSGSTLYGMTYHGGNYDDGTIFSIPVTGGAPTILFPFDSTHGKYPVGGLTLSGSTIYGVTSNGGANNEGTVFSIPVTGGVPNVLFSFDNTHGEYPIGNLTLSGSTLYGMTHQGGPASIVGTIFSIPVTGGTPTTLFSFDWTHGQWPSGSLTLSGSTLYGMAPYGGANGAGTVFSIPVTGGIPNNLFSFDRTHGSGPVGSLTLSGATLYGMTPYGGNVSLNNGSGYGTIFSIPVSGGTPTVLYSFDGTHGELPSGSLTLSGSTLYGTTQEGGANGDGTVFALHLLQGDANNDGIVDINDLTIILADFGKAGMTWSQGEFTGSGTVDINDLTIVLANFGTTNGAGIKAVPEPSTILLFGIAFVASFLLQRRMLG